MLIWSRKGRAAAGALAVTLFAGVFLLPLAVILLSSLSKQWNGLLPTGFTFAHFVNAFRGAAWDSLFSSLMVGFCASLLALLCGMWAALALRQYGATLQKYLGLAFYLPSAIPSVSAGLDDAAGDHFQPHRSRQYRRWLGADHCAGGRHAAVDDEA
ncbi:hypothetical protein NUBL13793_28140 [Klebsiella pneumoniae]|nr:hypothetical protein NUBL13793_28140 [Klebsiella pneumoniae]